MKAKTTLIIKHLHKKGKVALDMDQAFGHAELIINNSRDGYIVSAIKPAGISANIDRDTLVKILDANAIYIKCWR